MIKSLLQPIDRTALALMFVLSLMIVLLVSNGDRTAPRVRDFNWQDKQIGAEDIAFTLNFSRPMDHASVEKNLHIQPLLPGKISWAGRRMAYTLTSPAPYGTVYKIELTGAKDRFTGEATKKTVIQPFVGQFWTRDQAFVYIGIEAEEKGRLIFYNLTKQQKTILTPKNLSIMDFKPYPDGNTILFSAIDANAKKQTLLEQQLYTVTTGLNFSTENLNSQKAGKMTEILENQNYQNLKFDLSADGKTIVVQRVNRKNPAEFGYWIVRSNNQNSAPTVQKMNTQPGGDFVITPDSAAVAITQGQGVAILPLPLQSSSESAQEVKPIDFLPQFGMVLNFTRDGSTAAMVKFNTNYTKSLFLVTNQGVKKELLQTTGSILSCQFHPQATTLYCLLTQLLKGKEYKEQPYLAAIDIKTSKVTPLLVLPIQRDIQMSLSPDGLAILFDQLVTSNQPGKSESLRTNEGETISSSRLWLFPIVPVTSPSTTPIQPEQLPLVGLHPRWLP